MEVVDSFRWQALEYLRIRAWDEEYVVHNDLSGDTHLLGLLAGRALDLLCRTRASLTVAELVQRLAEEEQLIPDDELVHGVTSALEQFDRLGLAERMND